MYIKQAFNFKHEFWRYLVGSAFIFIASMIGQVPFTIAVFMKMAKDGMDLTTIDQASLLGYLEPNLNIFLILLSFLFGFAGLILIIKTIHGQTIKTVTTARKKVDWKRIWFAFFFWGTISSSLIYVDYLMSPENYVYNFELKRFIVLAIIAIILVPIQTSLEEYLFRGYLMQGFGVATTEKYFSVGFIVSVITIPTLIYLNIVYSISLMYNVSIAFGILVAAIGINKVLLKNGFYQGESFKRISKAIRRNWVPLFITSSIFGLMHIANPEIEKLGYSLLIYYIGTGFFLGIITLMDEGMELALGFHAANNLFTALLVTANWTVFQTHSILKDVSEPSLGFIDLALPVFIIFPLLLFVFSKMYKWTNWKEKLFGVIEIPVKED